MDEVTLDQDDVLQVAPAVASMWGVFTSATVGTTRVVVKNIIKIAESPKVDHTSRRDIRESVRRSKY